jgi:hypothetical protein
VSGEVTQQEGSSEELMPERSVEEYQKLERTVESPQGEVSICRGPLDLAGQWRDLGRMFLITHKLRRNSGHWIWINEGR